MKNFIDKQKILSLIFFLLLVFFTLIIYILLSEIWVTLGRGDIFLNTLIFKFEIPLILLFLSFFHFSQIKNRFFRFITPIVPIVILYSLFDSFFNLLGRSPYPSDFQNFSSLWTFSPLMAIALMAIFLSIPGILLFLLYQAYKSYPSRQFKRSLFVRATLFSLTTLILTSNSFAHFHKQQFRSILWSQEDTIRQNGKFSSFFYYRNEEIENANKLENISSQHAALDIQRILYTGTITTPKNIHLIVLESFIDPRQIKDIKYSQSILAKELLPFLNKQKHFSLVSSPTYGGGTAQAEFELLTGVQALAKVNQIEFNVMKGGAMSGFVKKLKQNNYKTIATIATGAGFFNSRLAYKSLGFDEVSFLEENESFKQNLPLEPIFDGDVFDQNIRHLKKILNHNNTPVFNYVLGMYGHLPFLRNQTLRPDIAEISHPDESVKRIANQFYYRTKALANYIKQLLVIDKNSIIYITSDHLPPIIYGKTLYKLNIKNNISLFVNNGETIDVSGKKYYQLPWFIWDQLTESENPRHIEDKQMEAIYFQVLSESISS